MSKWVQIAGFVLIVAVAVVSMLLLATPAEGQATPPNTLEDFEVEAGWMLLFDGTTTEGWPVHSLETLLIEMGTRCNNTCRIGEGKDAARVGE